MRESKRHEVVAGSGARSNQFAFYFLLRKEGVVIMFLQ
jgi:hypothetical protein